MIVVLRMLCWLGLLMAAAGCQPLRPPDTPYLILVSIDGLGAGDHEPVRTPALDRIAAEGVRASGMRPVFPSMTFPNHYSIATGLYPFEHGIVDNTFPNAERNDWYAISKREAVSAGRWYGGEPIWVTAEKHGVISAAFFFVGTEADISGVRPTYWRDFDSSIPGEYRVRQVLKWLGLPEHKRPRLVTLYFEDVDDAAHEYGLGTAQWQDSVALVDAFLHQLLDGIERLPIADRIYIVVVSDHGQASLHEDVAPFVIADYTSLDGLDVIDHTSYVSLYMQSYDERSAAALADQINANWRYGRAHTRDSAPAHWRVTSDRRFADVIAMADPGFAVISRRDRGRRLSKGNHGYDPASDEMQATFLARGPRLPAGKTLGLVHAVDVYPLLTAILQLPLPAGYAIHHDYLRELLRD